MKKIDFVLLGAMALVFAACAKDLAPTNAVEMVQVKIDVTNTVAGKASLVSGRQLQWEVGDKITIVTDDGSAGKLNANAKGYTFTYTGTEASTSGTFAGELPSNVTPLYAIYPATDNFAPVKRNTNYSIDSFEIPTVQYAVKGGIKGEYNLSMGTVTGSDGSYAVTLESLCSLLKIVIPSDLTDIKDVTIRTALGQPVSGQVAPTPDKNLTMLNYIPEVSLRSVDDSPLEPGDYYVTVVPTLPNNNDIDKAKTNYGDSRITFTRTDGIVFTKKFKEASLLLEPNYVYALNFNEGMNLPLRTRTTVTCTLQAMADALKAGGYTTEEGRSTEDVKVTVDGLDFVLKSYVPKTGYANGWFTETKDGQLRVQNSNLKDDNNNKLNGYAMIQLPMTNGSANLTCVKFMTSANSAPFLLSCKIPYNKTPASLVGNTPGLSCPISGTAAYYSFWSSHTDATELYLASYSGGRNVFNGDIVCTYDVKYNETKLAADVKVENLGSASNYNF